jgi:hypothetical protein
MQIAWMSVFALLLWYSVNISTVILNKWLYQQHSFHFPLFLTSMHMLACLVLSAFVLHVLRLVPLSEVALSDRLRRIAPLA